MAATLRSVLARLAQKLRATRGTGTIGFATLGWVAALFLWVTVNWRFFFAFPCGFVADFAVGTGYTIAERDTFSLGIAFLPTGTLALEYASVGGFVALIVFRAICVEETLDTTA